MPATYSITIDPAPFTKEQYLMLVQLSMTDLHWQADLTGPYQVAGRTKMNIFNAGQLITATVTGDTLSLTSHNGKLIVLDPNKNASNINNLQEYIRLNASIWSPEQLNTLYVDQLAAPINPIISSLVTGASAYYATYSLIGINVLVFLIMVCNGVSFSSPNTMDIYHWGANIRLYTLGGEWWRLVTSNFLHIGFLHLFFNMYALFFVGRYLEPILKKWNFLLMYLCTGVLASLMSIWWTGSRVSAGASGAIFGLYGIFIALMTTKIIDHRMRLGLLQSFVIFVLYSLFAGMQPGIDNAAHMGGLLSGLLFGYLFYGFYHFKKSLLSGGLIITVVTTLFCSGYVVLNKTPKIKMIRYSNHFAENENKALAIRDHINQKSSQSRMSLYKDVAAPAWQNCLKILDSISKVAQDTLISQKRISLLRGYIQFRIKENDLLIARENGHFNQEDELDSIRNEVYLKLDSIRMLKQ